jgi:hypothetical protein
MEFCEVGMWNMTVFDSSKPNLPDGGPKAVCLCLGPETEVLPRMALMARMIQRAMSAIRVIRGFISLNRRQRRKQRIDQGSDVRGFESSAAFLFPSWALVAQKDIGDARKLLADFLGWREGLHRFGPPDLRRHVWPHSPRPHGRGYFLSALRAWGTSVVGQFQFSATFTSRCSTRFTIPLLCGDPVSACRTDK